MRRTIFTIEPRRDLIAKCAQIFNSQQALFATSKMIDDYLKRLAAQVLINILGRLVAGEVRTEESILA